MEIIPKIKTLEEKKLIGMNTTMSLAENKTTELWRELMTRREEIKSAIGKDLYSLQIYNSNYFENFDLKNSFKKWACVEVTNFISIPEKMDTLVLQSGLYAVFLYKGSSANNAVFNYIFSEWLPNSEYNLDLRPHFEVIGEKYKNNSPDSEEEIWIPIKPK
ncbi:GyrI-like domain-containing protein [Aurantibacillus circumpalustris]|uniref:GyrI-like domain-containing protein n=1 Tax=Aurantibacillus circumpalustris TaxID=3036359 RepID=UPI00295AB867|nr:GyrI-like domain-containing protein [Aurantibacillus circumpalustris]